MFFESERKAENFLKMKKPKIKGFKPTVQGNAIVFIPRKKRKK